MSPRPTKLIPWSCCFGSPLPPLLHFPPPTNLGIICNQTCPMESQFHPVQKGPMMMLMIIIIIITTTIK